MQKQIVFQEIRHACYPPVSWDMVVSIGRHDKIWEEVYIPIVQQLFKCYGVLDRGHLTPKIILRMENAL